MKKKEGKWNLSDTAKQFKISIGLLSENLKIARMIHVKPELLQCDTREEALLKLRNGN